MIDALNVYITDDVDGDTGNVGGLKNLRGNTDVMYASDSDYPSNSQDVVLKVIGSVTDIKTKICYFFVWSQVAADHGVWAYDKYGKLPLSKTEAQGVPNSLRRIFTSTQFNFPEHGFVKGDVVYTNTNEFEKHDRIVDFLDYDGNEGLKVDFEKDAILYFTDNVNEPRKINIYRALLEKDDLFTTDEYTGDNALELTDFICACPKVPLDRISFEFDADLSRSTNNFAAAPGFQFAYQNIYIDKLETAISAYSPAAFPPSIVNRGAAQTTDLLSHNVCLLKIPEVGPEVERIRILARYENSANFFEIDEVSNIESETANWDLETRTYKFYNDRVASGVSPQEVKKTFDNVPRKAQAQTAISNRLMYGNYLEQFDNVDTKCDAKVVYKPRPQDYLDLVIRATPSIEPGSFGQNKGVGFEIDTKEIPRKIYAGTVINIVIEYEPDRNFHLYQAHNVRRWRENGISDYTYHQNRHMGPNIANATGWPRYPLIENNNRYRPQGESWDGEAEQGEYSQPWGSSANNGTHDESQAHYMTRGDNDGTDRWVNSRYSGANFLEEYGYRYFGWNFGVGAEGTEEGADWIESSSSNGNNNNPRWSDTSFTALTAGSSVEADAPEFSARYGTSAGNPLILQGCKLQFEVKFTVVQDELWNGDDLVAATIVEALAGANGEAVGVVASELIEATGLQPGTMGTGIFSFQSKIQIDVENDVTKVYRHEYDLGLNYEAEEGHLTSHSFEFPTIIPGDTYSNLIVGVANDGGATGLSDYINGVLVTAEDVGNTLRRGYAEALRHQRTAPPAGAFIINKASIDFYIETIEDDDMDPIYEGYGGFRKKARIAISKIEVEEEDVLTCVRRAEGNSPWWLLNKDSIIAMQSYFADLDSTSTMSGLDTPGDVANKFYVSNSVWGGPTNHTWYKAFKPKHDINEMVESAGDTSGNFYEYIQVMRNCFGRLMFADGQRSLYKPHSQIFNTPEETVDGYENMYRPVLGKSRFRFSLMDGEGGPGAAFAGGNSAYDKYDLGKYGSLAGRLDFNFKISDVKANIYDFGAQSWTQGHHTVHAVMGGTVIDPYGGPGASVGDSTNLANFIDYSYGGYTSTTNWDAVAQYSLVTDEAWEDELGEPGENWSTVMDGAWARTPYVLSGPLYTGSIAMLPIYGEDTDNLGRRRPYPEVRPYTTTLPLIWVGGTRSAHIKRLNDWGTAKLNWLKTSFPWPQTDVPTGPHQWNDGMGGWNSYGLDNKPFRQPKWYADGWTWDGTTNTPQGSLSDLGGDSEGGTVASTHSRFGSVDYAMTHSHLEGHARSMYTPAGGNSQNYSFKSSATHEFGVVYYDQRGRHGYVNHLDSVFVDGYAPSQRTADESTDNVQGPAHIQLTLRHEPPEWAHNYKIVYSKNTSVSDFLQYSAGGAFTAQGESVGGDPSRIYVSLNYLQGHTISYSDAWGARSEEGSPILYTHREGDRLRVISYMLPSSSSDSQVPTRVYPYNYDFEISGMVNLDESESNPLGGYEDVDNNPGEYFVDENKKGLFLLLKNNGGANGFRYQDVRDEAHHWGDNCIIEIYSPVKELDSDDRLYYEIGKTYSIFRQSNGSRWHEGDSYDFSQFGQQEMLEVIGHAVITLTEGDVWFRSHAVNLRDHGNAEVTNAYPDIIVNTETEGSSSDWEITQASEANFKSYYLEAQMATDLFKSHAIHIGRPNMIKQDAQETYKEASVIHSDRDILDHGKVSYSSFNRSVPIDKDLDLKSGEINYLGNWDDQCVFVQKDKCGYFGIDRTMISDLQGEKSLIASSKFINEPQYYLGRAGADGNPESVYVLDNSIYFAHKSLGKVFKASGGGAGVQTISDTNMRSWFRDTFQNAMNLSMINGEDVRVVGGYDPMKQEYLLSILNPETRGLLTDPFIPDVEVVDPEGGVVPGTGGPGGPPPTSDVVPYFNITWGNGDNFKSDPPTWFVMYNEPGYLTNTTGLIYYLNIELNNFFGSMGLWTLSPGQELKLTIELNGIDTVSYQNHDFAYAGTDTDTRYALGSSTFADNYAFVEEEIPGRKFVFTFNSGTNQPGDDIPDNILLPVKLPVNYDLTLLEGVEQGNLYPKPNFLEPPVNEDVFRNTVISYQIDYSGMDVSPASYGQGAPLAGLIQWRLLNEDGGGDGGNGNGGNGNGGNGNGGNGVAHEFCNYPMLVDENGHITHSSILAAYIQVTDMLDSGEIMQADALTMVPNLAQSVPPMITMTDQIFALAQWSEEGYGPDNPLVCSVNGGNGGARLGCTDPTAINYDPTATVDDGSCIYDNGSEDDAGGESDTPPPPPPTTRKRRSGSGPQIQSY